MIAQFPAFYSDELVYSLLARYYVHTGYLAYRYAAEDLYVHPYTVPDMEFINELRADAAAAMTQTTPMERVIEKHTMFAAYGRFLPKERRTKAFRDLIAMHGNYNNLLSMPKRRTEEDRVLRYCPVCAKQDRKQYGETYWHRAHQIMGVYVCPVHGCYLENTPLQMTKNVSPDLIAAERTVPEGGQIKSCDCAAELRLADYVIQVFQSPIASESDVEIGEFLRWKLNKQRYLSKSGAMTDITQLYEDYTQYYQGVETMREFHMQKILSGQRFNFYDICQMALFENISADELASINPDMKAQALHSVFSDVAEELQADYALVKKVGEAVLKRYQKNGRVQRKCSYRSYAWAQMDAELLPRVQQTVQRIYGTGIERPRRVTVSAVCRELHLPDKRFDNLPKCKAEILKWQEPQKAYWARETVWAYQALLQSGKPLNWKGIRNLTNMRNIDFQNCKPYLRKYADNMTAAAIESLL